MIAIFDIHDTIADFINPWLRLYNKKWDDNLKKEDIKGWHLADYVKPECGEKIYDLLRYKRIYSGMRPIPYALETVNEFRAKGFEIGYATASIYSVVEDNFKWLNKYGFWQDKDHFIVTKSKHLIRADIIFDDGPHNLQWFRGYKMLVDQPWNQVELERVHGLSVPNRIYGFEKTYKELRDFPLSMEAIP